MKKLLALLFASLLVLGACGQKEESPSKDDTKESKEVKKDVKKEDKKEDKDKEVTKKAESKSEEQATEEVATNEQQTTQEAAPTEEVTQEQQTVEQPVQQPTQEETVQDNYINQDAEFYDSLPQEEKDKMARQIEIQSSISEDDPRWDEQYEINMRDDISDAERERLSDQVWK